MTYWFSWSRNKMGCKVHLAVTPVITAPGLMIFDGAAQGGFWRDFLFAALQPTRDTWVLKPHEVNKARHLLHSRSHSSWSQAALVVVIIKNIIRVLVTSGCFEKRAGCSSFGGPTVEVIFVIRVRSQNLLSCHQIRQAHKFDTEPRGNHVL